MHKFASSFPGNQSLFISSILFMTLFYIQDPQIKKMLQNFQSILLASLLLSFVCSFNLNIADNSLESLASQFAGQTTVTKFNTRSAQGFNMDCLKAIKDKNDVIMGVFHSGMEPEQKLIKYNAIYFAKQTNNVWNKISKLSSGGSQGYIYQVPDSTAYLVLYELEHHTKGNTVAIKYYQNIQKLQNNSFLYEYQLTQLIDKKKVVNIGTPSVESITLTKKQIDSKFNEYKLNIKFHYCPDGSHDFPGLGQVTLFPLRDFVDAQKRWVGGCKQNYTDWTGNADSKVENAIRKIGIQGKIGQRDVFWVKGSKYYFYEANLNAEFDWMNWRIVLYSASEERATLIPFNFSKVVDVANPHISQFSYDQSANKYTFWVSFFLPGEGITPGTGAEGGEMTAISTIAA